LIPHKVIDGRAALVSFANETRLDIGTMDKYQIQDLQKSKALSASFSKKITSAKSEENSSKYRSMKQTFKLNSENENEPSFEW
jgi:hypothetical protein